MKNNIIFTLLMGILILSGCGTTKEVVTQPQEPEVQQATRVLPTKWMQNTYPSVSTTDPITFYNEYKIIIKAKIPKKMLMFQDGVTYYVDSSTIVELTIPKLTPGVLFSVDKKNNLPTVMVISFDESNPDYNISFYSQTDKSFAQDARCEITFEGKKYKAEAIIVTKEKNAMNYLLSNFESLDKTNKVEKSAGGRNATGTKIIKQ
jgi:hypothetical protein